MHLTDAIRQGHVRAEVPRFTGYSQAPLRVENLTREPIEIDFAGVVNYTPTGRYQPLLYGCFLDEPGGHVRTLEPRETWEGRFRTFCLDSGASCPTSNLQVRLRSEPVEERYREALAFFLEHPDMQGQVQSAIWGGGDTTQLRQLAEEREAQQRQAEGTPDPEADPEEGTADDPPARETPMEPIEGFFAGEAAEDPDALRGELADLRSELDALLEAESATEEEAAAHEREIDRLVERVQVTELRLADAIAGRERVDRGRRARRGTGGCVAAHRAAGSRGGARGARRGEPGRSAGVADRAGAQPDDHAVAPGDPPEPGRRARAGAARHGPGARPPLGRARFETRGFGESRFKLQTFGFGGGLRRHCEAPSTFSGFLNPSTRD